METYKVKNGTRLERSLQEEMLLFSSTQTVAEQAETHPNGLIIDR